MIKQIGIVLTFLTISFGGFAQTKVDATCSLWNPKNFCDLSDTVNISYSIYCRSCTWTTLTCEQMENKKGLQGVHIRFSSKTDSAFSLTSKFKNISLKKKTTGKIIHPYAILMYGMDFDSKTGKETAFVGYMTNRFKVHGYDITYSLNKPYDLIMLFNNAETGDKIVIDNFIETEIEK
jgi:hypothetical protein